MYTFLPTWQSLTLDAAGEVFRAAILSHCKLWVCERAGVVRAYMAMDGSLIDRMYVDPDDWRQGWGRCLITLAKELHPTGLELFTHTENHGARQFHEKHGSSLRNSASARRRNQRQTSNTTSTRVRGIISERWGFV